MARIEIMLRYSCNCLQALATEQRFKTLEDIGTILEKIEKSDEQTQEDDGRSAEEIIKDIRRLWTVAKATGEVDKE